MQPSAATPADERRGSRCSPAPSGSGRRRSACRRSRWPRRIAVSSSEVGARRPRASRRARGQRDAEPRTDTRLHLVTVAPTPGVVLLASPGDWDSRFLYRALREVAQLPVRGFVRIEGERWRSMTDLRPVPAERVRQAARQADLLILKGDAGPLAAGNDRARHLELADRWQGGRAPIPGDWYLSASDASPVAGAFLGQPVDSFPPASGLTPIEPECRRLGGADGPARPPRRRASRGVRPGRGSGADASRSRWTVSGAGRSAAGPASRATAPGWRRPRAGCSAAPTRRAGSPARSGRSSRTAARWCSSGAASGPARSLAVTWSDARGASGRHAPLRRRGTGDGLAAARRVPVPTRGWRRRDGGGGGVLRRAASASSRTDRHADARVSRPTGRTAARDWLWLFARRPRSPSRRVARAPAARAALGRY